MRVEHWSRRRGRQITQRPRVNSRRRRVAPVRSPADLRGGKDNRKKFTPSGQRDSIPSSSPPPPAPRQGSRQPNPPSSRSRARDGRRRHRSPRTLLFRRRWRARRALLFRRRCRARLSLLFSRCRRAILPLRRRASRDGGGGGGSAGAVPGARAGRRRRKRERERRRAGLPALRVQPQAEVPRPALLQVSLTLPPASSWFASSNPNRGARRCSDLGSLSAAAGGLAAASWRCTTGRTWRRLGWTTRPSGSASSAAGSTTSSTCSRASG